MAKKQRDKIIRLSYGAILSALSVVLLMVGGVLELLDMTSAMLASLAVLVSAIEFGVGHSLLVYSVSSCLSLIFMPTSSASWYYVLVIGYFPALHAYLERKVMSPLLRYAAKALAFNVGVTAALLAFVKLYGLSQLLLEFSLFAERPAVTLVIIYALLNVFLAAYNVFLPRVKFLYIYFFHRRGKAKKIFK